MAANLTMTGTPLLVKSGASKVTVIAGEALTAGDCCYIKSDGLAWQCDKSIVTIVTTSNFQGITITSHAAGDPVTLFGIGAQIYLTATAQTIGTLWYISDTPGKLYDAAVAVSDTQFPVVKFITANVVEVVHFGT